MKKFNVRVYVLRAIVEMRVTASDREAAERAVERLFGPTAARTIDAVEVVEP